MPVCCREGKRVERAKDGGAESGGGGGLVVDRWRFLLADMRETPGGSAYDMAMLEAEDREKSVGAKKCWGKKIFGEEMMGSNR